MGLGSDWISQVRKKRSKGAGPIGEPFSKKSHLDLKNQQLFAKTSNSLQSPFIADLI